VLPFFFKPTKFREAEVEPSFFALNFFESWPNLFAGFIDGLVSARREIGVGLQIAFPTQAPKRLVPTAGLNQRSPSAATF